MNTLKLIFAGTGAFAAPIIETLVLTPHVHIPFVITAPDKPSGRGLSLTSSPVKLICEKNKIFVQQPRTILELIQNFDRESPDILLVVDYGEIIPKKVLDKAKFGGVNIHPSLLPLYRGSSPIQEALLHGDSKTGVTWIKMTPKMDAGPIIYQETLPITNNDTYPTLSAKLSFLAVQKTPSVLLNFAKNMHTIPQNETHATYCKKIEKADGLIQPERETAEQILNKIRAYTPWPGCYIFLDGKRIKVIQAMTGEQKISAGEMKRTGDAGFAIGTKQGVLLPAIVQPESKKPMTIAEFLRGFKN